MISGTTKILGILGYPLEYTISPVIHNCAISHLGLDLVYLPLRVEKEKFGPFFSSLKFTNIIGVNVTMPFKEEVVSLVDELGQDARGIGAVNTVVFKNGVARGENTDAAGFILSLKDDAHFDPAGRSAVVIGAGGAAKAIVYALISNGVREVKVINRNEDKAASLALYFKNSGLVKAGSLNSFTAQDLNEADLWVNATPVGLEKDPSGVVKTIANIKKGAIFYDLVYMPKQTALMEAAQNYGAKAHNGIGMLIRQAALSFSLWTGKDAPLEEMRTAALSSQQQT